MRPLQLEDRLDRKQTRIVLRPCIRRQKFCGRPHHVLHELSLSCVIRFDYSILGSNTEGARAASSRSSTIFCRFRRKCELRPPQADFMASTSGLITVYFKPEQEGTARV